MSKTYEIVVRGKMCATPPNTIPSITRKTWLKLLGVTVEETPGKWDIHFEEMLKKTSERMYILRVCKYYGFTKEQLDLLFPSLIMPLFTFAVEIWGGVSHSKYISNIDKFINHVYRDGYTKNRSDFKKLIIDRDMKLCTKSQRTPAMRYYLLPNKLVFIFVNSDVCFEYFNNKVNEVAILIWLRICTVISYAIYVEINNYYITDCFILCFIFV